GDVDVDVLQRRARGVLLDHVIWTDRVTGADRRRRSRKRLVKLGARCGAVGKTGELDRGYWHGRDPYRAPGNVRHRAFSWRRTHDSGELTAAIPSAQETPALLVASLPDCTTAPTTRSAGALVFAAFQDCRNCAS